MITKIIARQKKVSGCWSSVDFKIGARTRFFSFLGYFYLFCNFYFCLPTGKSVIHVLNQISHIQIMVAVRGLTNRPDVHTLCRLKTQNGRIPIDPSMVWGDARGDQKPLTFLFGLMPLPVILTFYNFPNFYQIKGKITKWSNLIWNLLGIKLMMVSIFS